MHLVAPILCAQSITEGGNPRLFWDSRKCALPSDANGCRDVHIACDCRWFFQVDARKLRGGWYARVSANLFGRFFQIIIRPIGKRFRFVNGYSGSSRWSHYANRLVRCP